MGERRVVSPRLLLAVGILVGFILSALAIYFTVLYTLDRPGIGFTAGRPGDLDADSAASPGTDPLADCDRQDQPRRRADAQRVHAGDHPVPLTAGSPVPRTGSKRG